MRRSIGIWLILFMGELCSGSGTLLLCGGAMDDENSEVWNELFILANKPAPKIAVFCSGAPSLSDAKDAFSTDITGHLSYSNLFKKYKFTPIFIPIAIDNYFEKISDPATIRLIESSDAAFFNGGDQAKHARCLLQDDGSPTPLFGAVIDLLKRNGVVAGTSAGTAIQPFLTYGEGTSYGYLTAGGLVRKTIADVSLADPHNPDNGGYAYGFRFAQEESYAKGKGLGGVVIDTHVGGRGRIGRTLVAMRDLKAKIGIGIDENTALVFYPNDNVKVLGQYAVYFISNENATYSGIRTNSKYFRAEGLTAYSLSSGDSLSLQQLELTTTKELITDPYYNNAYDSYDIFNKDEAYKVMDYLVDSRDYSAYGYSYEDNPTIKLEFYKKEGTKGYYSESTRQYAVYELNLDVSIESDLLVGEATHISSAPRDENADQTKCIHIIPESAQV